MVETTRYLLFIYLNESMSVVVLQVIQTHRLRHKKRLFRVQGLLGNTIILVQSINKVALKYELYIQNLRQRKTCPFDSQKCLPMKSTYGLLATQLLAEFGFSHATLKPEIFDHRTTNSREIWPPSQLSGGFVFSRNNKNWFVF